MVPFDLDPVGWIACGAKVAAIAKELELHERWASDRYRGEWFHATADLLAFIEAEARPWNE